MKKYFLNKSFFSGFVILLFLILFFIIGSFFCKYDYDAIDTSNKFLKFSSEHILGTDYLGRDVFARLSSSMKLSFLIGFSVVISGFITGVILGALSGFFGGIVDSVISKLVDTQMSFPGILLALMLIAVFGTDTIVTVTALYIMSIPRFTRIARSGFIKYKNSLFVLSAKAKGAGVFRILFHHILPNVIPQLIVTSTLSFSLCILSESGLSFLGLGIQPPLPSFGSMLSEGQRYILLAPEAVIIPAVTLILLVLSFNLIGDGISETNEHND